MTIWIDTPIWPAHGRLWCHVISDRSLAELHTFAERAAIPARSFEGDHYDVPAERWAEVIAAGARPTSGGDLARRLAASGLRFRKRRGERPLGRHENGIAWLERPHTVEVVASGHEPHPGTGATVVLVSSISPATTPGGVQETSMVLVRSENRPGWAPPGGKREPGESVRRTGARELAEETGLEVAEQRLLPVGYERITLAAGHGGGTWAEGVNLLAVMGVQVPEPVPVRPRLGDVVEARWVGRALAHELCGHEPWWPLVQWWWEHHLGASA